MSILYPLAVFSYVMTNRTVQGKVWETCNESPVPSSGVWLHSIRLMINGIGLVDVQVRVREVLLSLLLL
ncbi:hypothetical protein BT69DRAFT_475559 [Atractiella rhizophila]|nr:hypothetical protein BT69DRAFT_475559 [Atractiella rhizophila]